MSLFPAQVTHAEALYRALVRNRAALDTSDTGTGKTYVASHIARHWVGRGRRVCVVCPKAVITNWRRVLEAHGVEPEFVLNYEKLRTGRHGGAEKVTRQRRIDGKLKTFIYFEWRVPPDTLVIFDEVQACKGDGTQNSQLLIAARKADLPVLALSATAAKDPTEMKALGYVLGLHDLHSKRHNNTFYHFQRRHGCTLDPFGMWKLRKGADLSKLRHLLYVERKVAHGMTVRDLPDAFKNNHVQIELADFKDAAKVYAEGGVTAEAVDRLMGDLEAKKLRAPDALTEILRARQLVEAMKVPHFIDEARDLLAEGRSVVVFLNFRDSIKVFADAFPGCGVVIGDQPAAERQQVIDDFAADRSRVIVVSAQAGGSGISLHDTRGEFPRVALISPTFSVQVYKQVLGRVFRAGMLTDALQRVVLAAGTIEEYVHARCAKGVRTMEDMLGPGA